MGINRYQYRTCVKSSKKYIFLIVSPKPKSGFLAEAGANPGVFDLAPDFRHTGFQDYALERQKCQLHELSQAGAGFQICLEQENKKGPAPDFPTI